MLFETQTPIPTYRDHYRSSNQTIHYEYLRTVLQVRLPANPGCQRVSSAWSHR